MEENQTPPETASPSPATPPPFQSNLVGMDGKPLHPPVAPEAPAQRPMPTRQEKFNLVFMMVTLMTREERRQLTKMLKPLRAKLDVLYPNGMSEGDIKRDLEKAVESMPVPAEEVKNETTQSTEAPSSEGQGV